MQKTRYKSFAVRTLSTFVLIFSFILIIYWGHIPLVLMIFGLQVCIQQSGNLPPVTCHWLKCREVLAPCPACCFVHQTCS
jgi:hypothetical protein